MVSDSWVTAQILQQDAIVRQDQQEIKMVVQMSIILALDMFLNQA